MKFERKTVIWPLIKNELKPGSTVLDCGSGTGIKGLQFYLEKGLNPKKVVAVDGVEKCLKVLSDFGVKTVCVNLEETNLCNVLFTKFDIIVCVEIFEHLTYPCEQRLLTDVIKLLNTGGSLIISFPRVTPMDLNLEETLKRNPFPHRRQPDFYKILADLEPLFESFMVQKHPYPTHYGKEQGTLVLLLRKKLAKKKGNYEI